MLSGHASLLAVAGQELLEAGISVVPVNGKLPVFIREDFEEWKLLQTERLSYNRLQQLCFYATGIAVIGGQVSGGLEILDFDFCNDTKRTLWQVFKERAGTALHGIPFQRTGSRKGFQGAYRCPHPDHNRKLAAIDTKNTDPKKRWKYLIETRGEGGYALVPPSIHPVSQFLYEYVVGTFAKVPTISQDQRDTLINLCVSLTEKVEDEEAWRRPEPRREQRMTGQKAEARAVIDLFNQQERIEAWLEAGGYTVRGDWAIRPDGKRKTVKIENNRSYHNGTNDPMCDGRGQEGFWRTPFDHFLKWEHNNNFRTAIRDAARIVGVELISSCRPRYVPSGDEQPPNPPPPPPPPPENTENQVVIITDDQDSLPLFEQMRIPAVYSPRTLQPGVVEAVEPFQERIVVASQGSGLALAADFGAKLVELPERLATMVEEGTLTLIDLIVLMRNAAKPAFRVGPRLGKR